VPSFIPARIPDCRSRSFARRAAQDKRAGGGYGRPRAGRQPFAIANCSAAQSQLSSLSITAWT
jgi:hypothetical protein